MGQECKVTVVHNIMDDRAVVLPLSAEEAVVAAHELFDQRNYQESAHKAPEAHELFREHKLGFSCGDWIAYREPKSA